MEFVERIDSILKEKNLKRIALCEYLGLTHSALTDWNKRGTIPAADICLKIAEYLGTSVEYLVTGKEKNLSSVELTQEEEEVLDVWEDLNDFQKNTIKTLLESYKKENQAELKKDSV